MRPFLKSLALATGVVALLGVGTTDASPVRPGPPGSAEAAVGVFRCTLDGETSYGSLWVRGIADGPFFGFTIPAGGTTCDALEAQVIADAAAGGCTTGPTRPADYGIGVAVHFACSGAHDAVVAAFGAALRSVAAVTGPGFDD